jgi:hypothetical protein
MPSKHPAMKLSRDEDLFLRHWMYEEVHFQDGPGPAKRQQLLHQAIPADLAILVAAAIPDLAEQEAAGQGPPPAEPPRWPWTAQTLPGLIEKARTFLAENRHQMAQPM